MESSIIVVICQCVVMVASVAFAAWALDGEDRLGKLLMLAYGLSISVPFVAAVSIAMIGVGGRSTWFIIAHTAVALGALALPFTRVGYAMMVAIPPFPHVVAVGLALTLGAGMCLIAILIDPSWHRRAVAEAAA